MGSKASRTHKLYADSPEQARQLAESQGAFGGATITTNHPESVQGVKSDERNRQARQFAEGFDDGLVRTVGSGGATIKTIGMDTGIGELLYPLGAGLEGFAGLVDRHNYENKKQIPHNLLEVAKTASNPNRTLFHSWI